MTPTIYRIRQPRNHRPAAGRRPSSRKADEDKQQKNHRPVKETAVYRENWNVLHLTADSNEKNNYSDSFAASSIV